MLSIQDQETNSRRTKKPQLGSMHLPDDVNQLLVKPIHMADKLTKLAGDAHSFKQECVELKSKSEQLAGLLHQAARVTDLYEQPTTRIMLDAENVLSKALAVVAKYRNYGLLKRFVDALPTIPTCRNHGSSVKRVVPGVAFEKVSSRLESSICNVSWLLRVSSDDEDQFVGLLPPISFVAPLIGLIWEQIATLRTGSLDKRSTAAASLVSLAGDNELQGRLIIKEGGVGPLLKLVEEGQENAARAIGLLGRDAPCVEHLLHAGVCSVFAKVLKEGPMKVQAMVAWAIAELVANYRNCQNHFALNNVVNLLIDHLKFETSHENCEQRLLLHEIENQNQRNKTQMQVGSAKLQSKSMEHNHHNRNNNVEDGATEAEIRTMAAKALWQLAKGNVAICRRIDESEALLCFALLLEKGMGEAQFYSAMAIMEISRVAEQDTDLCSSAFKPNSAPGTAVIDQVLRIVEEAESSDLLVPCIIALGCLSKTSPATDNRIIGAFVRLLQREGVVSREAAIALYKFVCADTNLHIDRSKGIIDVGGIEHLIQLVYLGKQEDQIASLVLLCYIAVHVPDSEALAQAEVITVFKWASGQGHLAQDPSVDSLVLEATNRLELYQPFIRLRKLLMDTEEDPVHH